MKFTAIVFSILFLCVSSVFSSIIAPYSGGSGTSTDPFLISTVSDWQALIAAPADWDKHFLLTNDIDFESLNLTPIAPDTDPFTDNFQGTQFIGSFDGQRFALKNARIDLSDQDFVGLFGRIGPGGQLLNLGADNISVLGRSRVGGLAGQNYGGTISKCFTTGSITAANMGLSWAGGLVGATSFNGTIVDCYSTASVSGYSRVGGLTGQLTSGEIRRCYAAGNVTAVYEDVGGLVGLIYEPTASGDIRNCYASGSVSGNTKVGGLVGQNYRGKVFRSYATGALSGTANIGGLCGAADTGKGYEDTANYWDIETSGTFISAMSTGKTTSEMKSLITFSDAGWNFDDAWAICEGTNYPRLQWQIPAADWFCPDGVNLEDLSHLASQWLLIDCTASENCDGADLNADGVVDLADWVIFASEWKWNM